MVCRSTSCGNSSRCKTPPLLYLPVLTPHRDHRITPVLHQLHWLPVQRRVEFKTACLVHQSLASTAPTYLSADIPLISEHGRPHLYSSSHRTMIVSWKRTSFGDRSFAAEGPRLWNTLPSTLRQMTSYGQFRRHIKAHLFRACTAHCHVRFFLRYTNTLTHTYVLTYLQM